ncbi:Retrovirus-related Pol polyprotein from transposon 17.6, partial [Mucuna pruriens]
MPFGLKNAGATYQRAMVALFHDMMHKEIEVYVDDMIAKSKTLAQHIEDLRKLFLRLCKYKLRLNPAKCTFEVKTGKLLGFVVNENGIEVDPDKVKAIREMPAPKSELEVRGFLGRINFISLFISQLTATCSPIFKLLQKKKKKEWDSECQEAFDKITRYLENPPILVSTVPGRLLILYLTVLEESMGCFKKFTELRYSLERTCCTLVWAAKRLRPYMLSHTTWLVAKNDPVKYIFEKPALTGRIVRWQMALSEYDIHYVSQTAIKGSALAEQLAYHPLTDSQPLSYEFPDETLTTAVEYKDQPDNERTMWFDGASNVVGNGIGVVLVSPNNQCFPFAAKLGFDCTNNMAEYEACTMGLLMALEYQVKRLKVFGDSALVIYQLRGEWETRDAKLIPYHDHVREIMTAFDTITFCHVPREENQTTYALATLSAMVQVNEGQEMVIQVRQQPQTAYCQCLTRGMAEPSTEPWYFDIKKYLEKGEYPDEASENSKRTLRRLASGFLLSGIVLYKRNTDMTLLRCVDSQEAEQIMEEVHEGIFGTHVNGHALARKILRAGYYWTRMESDCYQHVRKCAKCQIHANHLNVAPSTRHNLNAPWPFSMWGIDVIGPIEPKASNGHWFILVAIDYFTKWVEAASYSSVTRSIVVQFIKKDIICRYGLPAHIITDNGTNLNNKMMTELCEQFRITHHNSTPYRPKMNGAIEATNKNLKKIIQKMVVTYKDWHEILPYALHGYRTSVRTSTEATPYSLVYGTKAVLPVEVEIPALRVLAEANLDEAEWVQQRLDQLNLIEEKRLTALCHGQLYQKRVKRAFDKKVKPRVFQKGDMVLKKVLPNLKDPRGKWAPNYEGPYVVKQAFSSGALILTNADGQDLKYPINAVSVRIFYP